VESHDRDYGAALADAERVLDGVDRALQRLDEGTYGTCELCGAPVADDVLAATPLATGCERHLIGTEPGPG
jgi:RNA polymerase-binding transcription factor DksA